MLRLSWSWRLLQDLPRRLLQNVDIPPRHAAIAVTLVLALPLGMIAAFWHRPSPTSTSAPSEPIRSGLSAPVSHPTPTAEIGPPERRRFPSRESVGAALRPEATGSRPGVEGSGAWWVGTMALAVALALIGWGSVAARRYLPQGAGSGPVAPRVIGHTSLSPKHAVYLLDIGGRVLIVGTGPQSAPSLLGELGDPAGVVRAAATPRFNHRPGDES